MSRPALDAMTLPAEANARNCVCAPRRDARPDQVPARGRTAWNGSRLKCREFALRSTLSPELRAFSAALVTLLVSILSTLVLVTTDPPALETAPKEIRP